MKKRSYQQGYVISLITFFVLMIMLSIAISMSAIIAYRQKNSTNIIKSTQSYYAAESGIEDALLRLNNSPQMAAANYTLTVNGATASIAIPAIVGGSRAVTSQGNNNGIIRNIQTVYAIDNDKLSFYYGVEVGAGGLSMSNGSEILGNVFSGGSISGSGTIDNNAVVSGNGNSIQGVTVSGDALVYSCLSPANVQNLTYVTGGVHTCTVHGTTTVQANEISQQPLPIPQSQIDSWKSEAATACDATAISNISKNNKSVTLGPCKVTGNLVFGNSDTVTLTGTLYVNGNITFNNTDTVKLDSSYSTLGGVILADGTINTGNGNTFSGSGQTGSYLLMISTSTSDLAIVASNNTNGAVFYTTAGGLNISNNVSVIEATGYKVIMGPNSKIQYSSGVVNIFFSGGPGGGWRVTSWEEK